MELKTPLYEKHLKHKAKIVNYAGYLMPVQYSTGLIAEHLGVRNNAGIFDVSHMGEIVLKGKDALANLQYILTNDFTSMKKGQVRYSPMCYEDGGTVDDLLVYKIDEEEYFLIVNAGNHKKDVDWIKGNLFGEVEFEDISNEVGLIALQGPKSLEIIKKLLNENEIPNKNYTFINDVEINSVKCMISQTGYTGEYGFEILCQSNETSLLWDTLMKSGEDFGLIPAGLGARDTLRLEAAMPLYGHELSEKITPLDAGLGFAVKMDKENFIGKRALEIKGEGLQRRVGLKVIGRGIVRENCKLLYDGNDVGITSSGTLCPYLNHAYAMAFLNKELAVIGTELEAENRGRLIKVEVVSLPFYKRKLKQEELL
ncbi:MAG TPA: glycine cleavage system aminomethyltransferase GcvT [Clostridiales bacterium]|nr:glycine cleavage system aminomethyltransferase GcvT [Clostridiales bacterium]